MVNCNMPQSDRDDVVDGPVVSEGGRSPSTLSTGQGASPVMAGVTLGPLAPGQRWSVARKREVVLRLMRGGATELLSRELGLPVRLVAAVHDTSAAMVEKHYGAFIVDATEDLLRRAVVPLSPAAPATMRRA